MARGLLTKTVDSPKNRARFSITPEELDALNKYYQNKRPRPDHDKGIMDNDIPVSYIEFFECIDTLNELLKRIPLKLKKILLLRILGYSYEEIAYVLGTNREYVRLDINWMKFLWKQLNRKE